MLHYFLNFSFFLFVFFFSYKYVIHDKMSEKPHVCLSFLIIIIFASAITAIQLPYEVYESIMELSDLDDYKKLITQVNVSNELGPTRPIYRLDLDPEYVAYYEIDTGNNYVIFSSGPKTGDYRDVQSGPDPRPSDILIQQAQKIGHAEV